MKIHRISKGEFPPEGKYVLIYANNKPWVDQRDPKNVFWKVAKFERGISVKERIKLTNNGDPRSYIIKMEDEYGNNEVPYIFQEFGMDYHFGQDIDIWCDLPEISI